MTDREAGSGGEKGLTRRRVLAAAAGTALLAGAGLWGRFALGDSFERHVAAQLGIDIDLTRRTLDIMRAELGDYEVRAAGFLVATQGPVDGVLPEAVRREAVDAFVGPMFGIARGLTMPLAYAGLRETPAYQPCEVLVT